MPVVIGIRFKDSGKIYFFDPNHLETLEQGDHVIVETVRGPELAKVAFAPRDVDQSEIVGELKPVLRRAEMADFERMRLLNERQDELMARCAEKIQEHELPMRLVKAEYSFDGSRLTFYFTAEKRVDFRLLVRDLARTFKARIELRQIGPRDEAKLLGGIGPCGRLLCCATFLPDYARVSIKMAKDQDLPLNPSKISGVCGRLLCCLSYEHEQYLDIKARLPRKGMWVQTPDGPGEVVAVNVVRETVTVMFGDTGMQEEFTPDQVQEATERVGELARKRNEEGITPIANLDRHDKASLTSHHEAKHAGERHTLYEEIDNPDLLEALSMLEEGFGDHEPRHSSHTEGRSSHPSRGDGRSQQSPRDEPSKSRSTPDELNRSRQSSRDERKDLNTAFQHERDESALHRRNHHPPQPHNSPQSSLSEHEAPKSATSEPASEQRHQNHRTDEREHLQRRRRKRSRDPNGDE